MTKITLEAPKNIKSDAETLKVVLGSILEEYSDFDLHLMKRYIETKDLDESHFINI